MIRGLDAELDPAGRDPYNLPSQMRWWWFVSKSLIHVIGSVVWTLRSHGHERVPRTGGLILASNHQSYLDPPLVGSCLDREIHFMARSTLFEIPVFSRVIVACNAFPIARDSGDVKGVKSAIERLKAGSALLMFPEGTRTRDGRIGPMKSGIRLVAERAAVPIVPVLIQGAYKTWPKGRACPAPWGRIDIVFGCPLDPGTLEGGGLRGAIQGLNRELNRIKENDIHVEQEACA